jgi:hypothetical protein
MATARNPIQVIKEAKQIAQDHGCFVAEKGGEFLVYRKTFDRNVFVGKCKAPERLRSLVCRVTGFR